MTGFTEMVKKNLRESGADSATLELWDRITERFDKGRPGAVERSSCGKKTVRMSLERFVKSFSASV